MVIRERRHKITWTMLVPRKGTEFPWIAKRAAKFIDQLGLNRVTLGCDNEPAVEALAREIAQARQEGRQTVPERPPVGESQPVPRNRRTHGGTRGWSGQITESCTGASYWRESSACCKDTVLADGVHCASDEQVRHRQRRKDADTHTAWTKGQHSDSGIWGEYFVHAYQTSKRIKVGCVILSWSIHWNAELVIGISGCHRAKVGDQDTCGERLDNSGVGKMIISSNTRTVPWSPDGSDNAIDIQVGTERLVEMVPRPDGEQSGEDVLSQSRLRSVSSQ